MTIYIYGSKSFKNSINKVLKHANMKFRLSEEDSIAELSTLRKLKDAITENPKNIFLIDDEKIIKKNSLNFIKPKGGIEEEFLEEHGIGDLLVDDIEDIAIQIIDKLEKTHAQKEILDKENAQKQNNTVDSENNEDELANKSQNEIGSLVPYDVPYDDEILDKNIKDNEEFENSEQDNNGDEDDEEELNASSDSKSDELISKEKVVEETENSEQENKKNALFDDDFRFEEKKTIAVDSNNDEQVSEEEVISIDEDENLEEKGKDDMADEFSELDNLNEEELLDALSSSSTVDNVDNSEQSNEQSGAKAELNSSNVDEISSLITQLLNNKTLEITIKIKE